MVENLSGKSAKSGDHLADLIDEVYLPFTREQLLEHFAPVAGNGESGRWLAYYLASTANFNAFTEAQAQIEAPRASPAEIRRGRQIEKDERFWVVAALMALYEQPNLQRIEDFSAILKSCLGPVPPFSGCNSWPEALGNCPELFFEVNLASPPSYQDDLRQHLDDRMPEIPHLKGAARTASRLEGATKVDALLIAPDTGFTALFEAKVLSDMSCQIEFDARRNQIARNIDVMLEKPTSRVQPPMSARDPAKSCFILLTDELFKRNPDSRLYGWLMSAYQKDSDLLGRHLPHRDPAVLASVPARVGWLTWQDCNRVHPGACMWLKSDAQTAYS